MPNKRPPAEELSHKKRKNYNTQYLNLIYILLLK